MLRPYLLISTCFLLLHVTAFSQKVDSTADIILEMPLKFVDEVDSKVDLYTNRITSKTEKTLSKLSRWENRIKSLLEASSPETANRLFGNNQLTFTKLLQDYKQGEIILQQYQAPYNCLSPLNDWTKLEFQFSHLNLGLWQNHTGSFLWNRSFKSSRKPNKPALAKHYANTTLPTAFTCDGERSLTAAVYHL